jgi:hypothetical protein
MDYAEASYFDGYHFRHIAAWQDHQRQRRLATARRAMTVARRAGDQPGRSTTPTI